MIPSTRHQRGEGKIGCIVSLAVFVIAGAAAIKAVPVLWGDNELESTAKDFATRAGQMSVPQIEVQIKTKARELEIPEALAPGAIKVTTTGPGDGTCHVYLTYTRKVDFYGVYQWSKVVKSDVSSQYMNVM